MYQITEQSIKNCITGEAYTKIGQKTTVCVLTLSNGFEVVGSSACVQPEQYDFETGKKYAYENAFNKVWELEGYRLQQHIHDENQSPLNVDGLTGKLIYAQTVPLGADGFAISTTINAHKKTT